MTTRPRAFSGTPVPHTDEQPAQAFVNAPPLRGTEVVLTYDKIEDLCRDVHDLRRSLALSELEDVRILQRDPAGLLLAGVPGQSHPAADLAVHLHADLHRVIDTKRLVVSRPGCSSDAWRVAELLPQLLGQVRREGRGTTAPAFRPSWRGGCASRQLIGQDHHRADRGGSCGRRRCPHSPSSPCGAAASASRAPSPSRARAWRWHVSARENAARPGCRWFATVSLLDGPMNIS